MFFKQGKVRLKRTQFLGCGRGVAPLKLPLKAASSIRVVHVLTPMTAAEQWTDIRLQSVQAPDGAAWTGRRQPSGWNSVQASDGSALCRLQVVQDPATGVCEELRLAVQPAGNTLVLSSEGAVPLCPV